MVRRTLELARVGVHGSKGQEVTPRDLREIAETFSEQKSAPVTIGHELADWMPAFGKVTSVEFRTDTLYGDVELSDLLAEAADAGYYSSWSIGAPRRQKDGKRYLHHLAFLGAVPPAVKGLRELSGINLSDFDPADSIIHTTDKEAGMKTVQQLQKELEAEQQARQAAEERARAAEANKLGGAGSGGSTELSDAEKENAELRKQLAQGKKQKLLEAAKGKLPKAHEAELVALADSISERSEAIELSDADGKKESVSGIDLLTRVLKAIPAPVAEGELDLSDNDLAEPAGKASALDGLANYV